MGNQDITTHKFVAVLNKKAELGKVVNALAHMSLGLGASATPEEKELMGFIDYIDRDGNHHDNLSKNSFVILRADNSNQIRTARNSALEKGIRVVDFTSTMQEGTYLEQIDRTKETPEAELEYYGICMFGPIAEINELTRKFQLWKG
jgi:hypothetical protein